MRRLLWVLILIGLIGSAAGAVVISLSESGSVTVVSPGLVWTGSLAFGSVQQSLTVSVTSTQTFTLKNTGSFALTITYSCTCPTGLSILLGSPTDISGTALASGQQISGTTTLTIQPTAPSGAQTFTLLINGSA